MGRRRQPVVTRHVMSCGHEQEITTMVSPMTMCDECIADIRRKVGQGRPPWDDKTDRMVRMSRRKR